MILSHSILTGCNQLRKPKRWEGFRETGWNLVTVSSGELTVSCKNHRLCLQPGTFCLIRPEPVRFFEMHTPTTVEWVHFPLEQCLCERPEWTGSDTDLMFCIPPESKAKKILRSIREIRELEVERHPGWFPLCCNLISGIILRGNINSGKFHRDEGLLQIRNQLCSGKITIEEAAGACGMSRAVFFRRFKEAFGISPGACRETARLMKARELIENTSMPLAEVAEAAGMNNEAYLSTRFKKYCGLTPSAFRKYRNI